MERIGKIENITRHAEVSEKAIEKYLVWEVRRQGGICLKYSNPNVTGYPDRLICLPRGKMAWVELKSKGRKLAKIQLIRHEELRKLGFGVYVIDSKQGVDELINKLKEIEK